MDIVAVLRAAGGLATVLGLLAGVVWISRRYNLSWSGLRQGATQPRLAVIERLALDQRRAFVLIRRDDREHLVFIGPDAQLVIETGILARDVVTGAATLEETAAKPVPPTFAALLQAARRRPAHA